VDDLERVELSAVLDFFAAAPPDVAQVLNLDVIDLDGPAAFSIGAYPNMHLFNRVLGLEETAPVPDVQAWFGSRRCSYAISVRPGTDLERALVTRGYRRAHAFMKFRRGVAAPPEPETSLRIERIDKERADEYGAVVATVFGMPSPMDRWFAVLGTRPGWACFGAFQGDGLVGTGAAHIAGRLGWLGAAGTLPEARGRGAQLAILESRIRAAADAGARVLAVETVDRVHGQTGPSFRNVVRAGFEEAYVQAWWLPPE
jgi:hypothetical protein